MTLEPQKNLKTKRRFHDDPLPVKVVLISLTILFFFFLLILPIILIFFEGLKKGVDLYLSALAEPDAQAALMMTLTTVAWVVPLNTLFGILAAWAIAKFKFRGKTFLVTLLDLPFAVSPVIAGLIFVLLVGIRTPLGAWLADQGIRIIFAQPGIIIATIFVTFPFVARELIPLMQSLGNDDEEAALTLGARGWQAFFLITLPNIKWGLLYGIVLCNARAIGEFGAVSVVSGHIRGQTNTLPLHIEILYSEYNYTASFAVSTLLVFLALLTIAAKELIGGLYKKQSLRQNDNQ